MAVVPSGNVTLTVEPGSAVPETVSVPFGLAADDIVGASGAAVSVKALGVAGEVLPAGSVTEALTGPEVCGVADVTLYWPLAGTTAVPVVPSGNVTFTVEPGSAVPATVSVPFGFAVVVEVGASGGVASVNALVVAGEALPAGSVAMAETGPEVCGVGEVIEYWPFAGTTAVPVVPSGKVTLTVEPGSAVPATVSVPFGLAVVAEVGATGGV